MAFVIFLLVKHQLSFLVFSLCLDSGRASAICLPWRSLHPKDHFHFRDDPLRIPLGTQPRGTAPRFPLGSGMTYAKYRAVPSMAAAFRFLCQWEASSLPVALPSQRPFCALGVASRGSYAAVSEPQAGFVTGQGFS